MNDRDRRALVMGGCVIVTGLLLRVAPAVSARWTALNERLEQQRTLLVETRLAISGLPAMEAGMRALTGRVSRSAPLLLSGSTSADAARDLSARVASLAALEHASVTAINEAPDSVVAGSLRRVTIAATLQTDFRGVARLFERLANDSTLTVVQQVRISGSEPRAGAMQPERLQVKFRLTAWYLGPRDEG